ncbi:MAG: hypothetical protein HRF49_01570 [bacterium]
MEELDETGEDVDAFEHWPVRHRVFLRQLATAPERANPELLKDSPDDLKLWGRILYAIITENEPELRALLPRYLDTIGRKRSGKLNGIRCAADLYLMSLDIQDYAELRRIIYELKPERIDVNEESSWAIVSVALAAGFACDEEAVDEIEPWIYSFEINPSISVISRLLLTRPEDDLVPLFRAAVESSGDRYHSLWLARLAQRIDAPRVEGKKWGPLFHPERRGWYKLIEEDPFDYFKPQKLLKRYKLD